MAYKAVVIDDHGINGYLKEGLIASGFSVAFFKHPNQAIEQIQSGLKPHSIISDVHKHPGYDGVAFAVDARRVLNNESRIFLWSGLYGGTFTNGPTDSQLHDLYANGVIDGFIGKTGDRASIDAMLELVHTPHFLDFAVQHGIPIMEKTDVATRRKLTSLELLRKYNLHLSFEQHNL